MDFCTIIPRWETRLGFFIWGWEWSLQNACWAIYYAWWAFHHAGNITGVAMKYKLEKCKIVGPSYTTTSNLYWIPMLMLVIIQAHCINRLATVITQTFNWNWFQARNDSHRTEYAVLLWTKTYDPGMASLPRLLTWLCIGLSSVSTCTYSPTSLLICIN